MPTKSNCKISAHHLKSAFMRDIMHCGAGVRLCAQMPYAHIFTDILHIICLTSPRVPPGRLLVDRPAQLAQQVGTEEGTPRADSDHRIGPLNIGPLDWQCAQPSFCVEIRHAVTTPVVAHGNRFEGPSPQRMKSVRDSENLCFTIATVCNARLSIKEKSSAPSDIFARTSGRCASSPISTM